MIDCHSADFAEGQLEAISEVCKSALTTRDKVDCPLCFEQFQLDKHFRKHLGGELEELALFVLPKGQSLVDDSSSESDGDDFDGVDNDFHLCGTGNSESGDSHHWEDEESPPSIIPDHCGQVHLWS